jgi:hypothetical protein
VELIGVSSTPLDNIYKILFATSFIFKVISPLETVAPMGGYV